MAWKRPESLVKSRWNWYHALSRRFFLARNYLQRGRYKNWKHSQSFFSFLYPFILLSLPSCLYFLPVYMAWKRPESLVKSRWNWYHALSRRFFLARNYLQSGRYKNWKDSQSFYLPLPLYLAFTAVLSLFLARFHGLEVALEFREIKVRVLGLQPFSTVFINPDIYWHRIAKGGLEKGAVWFQVPKRYL